MICWFANNIPFLFTNLWSDSVIEKKIWRRILKPNSSFKIYKRFQQRCFEWKSSIKISNYTIKTYVSWWITIFILSCIHRVTAVCALCLALQIGSHLNTKASCFQEALLSIKYQKYYLNAGIPVTSIPVISKWMSWVPS